MAAVRTRSHKHSTRQESSARADRRCHTHGHLQRSASAQLLVGGHRGLVWGPEANGVVSTDLEVSSDVATTVATAAGRGDLAAGTDPRTGS